MRTILKPKKEEWCDLASRPVKDALELGGVVGSVFSDVIKKGDNAVIEYTGKFDKVKISSLRVSSDEIKESEKMISEELKKAIMLAAENVRKFHINQKEDETIIETMPGVKCWRESRPVEKVGIYIPGGTAPLFSTVIMLAVPAMIAGCSEIILCTPPGRDGKIDPAILFTAMITGVTSVYRAGGIQAIAAMTSGTESVARVDKIFGPGNQYVTAAKQYAQKFGVAIDMPAGPSEVLIIADETAIPEFVAADLLSQAEHGDDSQVILLSCNVEFIKNTIAELEKQLEKLPRREIASLSLRNSMAILLDDYNECIEFSNLYAPEHLIIAAKNSRNLIKKVINAGSVFIGNYSCESAGDYASGTNHTLPTNGYARNYSGVSLDSFIKKITFQEITPVGIRNIGPAIELMAEAENLYAHRNAITVRLKQLRNGND